MALYIVALQEGFLYGLLALGVYLSLRILDLPDLTCEGSFGFGAAVTAVAASAGHPLLSLPLALLAYTSGGTLLRMEDAQALGALLRANGWTWLTALNAILFSLMHWPCSTTLLSIARETRSVKWPLVGALLPTLLGAAVCALTAFVARTLGLAT